ncbi:hypothetical protein JANAI62_17590 [Jannaschia pagri]|uniref:Uncharacterized protein n=1 Tax=Jannaschia pagri TaxID=2829797 RepID=A0ABQ4NL45_9RHOB|nr:MULTISPECIES: hypothetical protein [unclassified Jannaschia]GIT91303.1 hypothetical protein JANAI61_17610 [Jannaschia sp. AI_61]GIT95136.1 hypothetical protein JANAI62_17590 [Jannaschia sp. AI_62]
MKRLIATCFVTAMLSLPAAAQTAPAACLADDRNFDSLLASLESEGWTALAPGAPLPDAAVERIALARTIFYASTDRGGSTLPEIMDLQRRTVPGLARRVDTDLAKQRVLTRGDAAMTFNWGKPQQGRLDIVEVICRIATPEGTPASGTDEGFGPSTFETLAEAPLRRVMVIALDPAPLSELTTDRATVSIVETVSVYNPEEGQ